MKKWIMILVFIGCCSRSDAQVIEIIKAGVVKIIKAVDLQIQRLQNKTIWLQNAQKIVETNMQSLKLGEISEWMNKQKELYRTYYEELARVKTAIRYYQQVRDIIRSQTQLVAEYKKAIATSRSDPHFSREEIENIYRVYSGILDQSVQHIDQLYLVLQSFATQMSDAKRLEFIHTIAARLDENKTDLRQFNQQNMYLSLQRSRDQREVDVTRKLYGIE